MAKKIILLTVILLAGLVLLLQYINRGRRSVLTDPLVMVPGDAPFFIETGSLPGLFNSAAENNPLAREMLATKGFEKTETAFNAIRSFLNRKGVFEIIENRKAVVSFHYGHYGKLSPLVAMTLPAGTGLREIEALFREQEGTAAEKLTGPGRAMKIWSTKKSVNDTLYLSVKQGIILLSNSFETLKRAGEMGEETGNIRNQPGIDRLISTAGEEGDKLYIVFRNLGQLVEKLTGRNDPDFLGSITGIAGSACFDIIINENGYLLGGYANGGDLNRGAAGFRNDDTETLTTFSFLPAGVSLFETIAIGERSAGKDSTGETTDMAGRLAAKLAPFIGPDITMARMPDENREGGKSTIIIYSLRNKDAAERIVNEEFRGWLNENNLNEKDLVSWFKPDDQAEIPVLLTPCKGLAYNLTGLNRMNIADSVIAFGDDFMITSDSREAVARVLYDNILNRTITNDIEFREFESTLQSKAGYFFYFIPAANIDLLAGLFNDTLAGQIERNEPLLKKISSAGLRYVPSNEMIYSTVAIRFLESLTSDTGTEWETKLDGMVKTRPFFFTNHNTGAMEIVVQDERNNLYLINSAGRILWKIQINEAVNGSFYSIDYYRNGKNQIFFAGRDYLHLVDRNGNYVDRFPVRLRASASGPASLYDYDNNRDYRIFVPGSDRLIWLYDKSGNVVKGWVPFKTSAPVKKEVKYFRVSGKDYIVVTDGTSVNVLDRTGNIRVKPARNLLTADNTEIRLSHGAPPSLVFTSPDGTLQFLSFDGKVTTANPGSFSSSHAFDFFDLDGDGYGEFLFIDKGKLYLYDNDLTEMFVRDFGSEDIEGPYPFIFSSTERMAGIFNRQTKQVFLIGPKGNDMEGFPLRGYSGFSIGRLSGKEGFSLIAGGSNNFLYNYKLTVKGKN